jgi:hypothetical protein
VATSGGAGGGAVSGDCALTRRFRLRRPDGVRMGLYHPPTTDFARPSRWTMRLIHYIHDANHSSPRYP